MRLIDADELLTAFPVDDEPMVTKSCIKMTIQHMPTIETKQGKWICELINPLNAILCCSACGYATGTKYNYCPNCGAKMKEINNEYDK